MKVIALLTVAVAACSPGAQDPNGSLEAMGWHEAKRAVDGEISEALNGPNGADYPRAIAAVENSGWPSVVVDRTVGDLILSAYRDGRAAEMPVQSVADGLGRLETAAMGNGEGRVGARQSLRLWAERGAGAALAPDPALAACWAAVEAGDRDATACVALRRKR